MLCVEREQAISEREQALAELKAEKNTILGWCNASEKVDKIIQSQRPIRTMAGIVFSKNKIDPQQDRPMLKFGMFVSSISDPSAAHCSSSSSNTEGTYKSLIKSDKGKAKVDHPSKTKTPKQKKDTKILGNGLSVSRTKKHLQKSTPRLKIDLTSKNKEKIPIPPISNAKGILGPGPADLKLKSFKSPDAKHFNYRKCYHCGLNDHVASKCHNATKKIG